MARTAKKTSKVRAQKSNANPAKATTFEDDLLRIARDAWDQAILDHYYPSLATPKFVFDPSQVAGFSIDTQDWRVTLNLLEVPTFVREQETYDFIHSISQHEIGHYDLCPYDGLTNATLLSAAMQKVHDCFAPLVVNIFADLVVDTHLRERFQTLTEWRMRETSKGVIAQMENQKGSKFSGTWKILAKAYEYLWGIDLGLTRIDTSQEDAKARRVAEIIAPKLLDQSTWPGKVRKIAEIMKTNFNEDFTLQVGTRIAGGPNTGLIGPVDYVRQFGDPSQIKTKEKVQGKAPKDNNVDADKFARGRNFKNFGAPARLAGLIRDESTLAAWYRGRARDLITIRIFDEKPGGLLAAYPVPWRIGDPLEDLDILLSAQVSPVIIPNITTRKWKLKEGPAQLAEKAPPDLLIVLDSSGSMNWNPNGSTIAQRGEYDIAAVAAFAAAHFAFSRGCKVAALNFSDIAITCNWTSQYSKIENVLLQYQGGGTVIPLQKLKNLVYGADRPVLVLIITDFGLNNFNPSIRAFQELAAAGNFIAGFFIGADPEVIAQDPRFAHLQEQSIRLYPVSTIKDLIGLVIEEIKGFY